MFFRLRHNQIHRIHPLQGESQAIQMNTARYRKAVYCALWVQAACRLLSDTFHSDSFNTSKRDAFILLPCLAIYNYFSVYKLITEPLYLLLEDQRSESSCKRNIKATRPSMER